MTDEQFIKRLGDLYQQVMALRKNDNYVVNQPQMEKFVEVYEFFKEMEIKCNGEVDPEPLIPQEAHGGLTARFYVFDVYGEDIQKFANVVSKLSALSIDAMDDGRVCISVTVPDVFVPVRK